MCVKVAAEGATGSSLPDTQGSSVPSPSELHVSFRWRGSPPRSLPTAQRRSVRRAHSDDSPLLVSHALSLERPPSARPPYNVKISEACLLKLKPIVDRSCEKAVRSLQPFGSQFRSRCGSQSNAVRFAVRSRLVRSSQPLGSQSAAVAVRSPQPFGSQFAAVRFSQFAALAICSSQPFGSQFAAVAIRSPQPFCSQFAAVRSVVPQPFGSQLAAVLFAARSRSVHSSQPCGSQSAAVQFAARSHLVRSSQQIGSQLAANWFAARSRSVRCSHPFSSRRLHSAPLGPTRPTRFLSFWGKATTIDCALWSSPSRRQSLARQYVFMARPPLGTPSNAAATGGVCLRSRRPSLVGAPTLTIAPCWSLTRSRWKGLHSQGLPTT